MDADVTTPTDTLDLSSDLGSLQAEVDELRARDLSDPTARAELVGAFERLAVAQHALGDWAGLETTYRLSDDWRRTLALSGDLEAVHDLAAALEGWASFLLGRPELRVTATECIDEAVVLRRALAQHDERRFRPALAHALGAQATNALAHGLVDAAVPPAREAAELYRGLLEHDSTVLAELASVLITLTEALGGSRSRRARKSALGVADEAVRAARVADRSVDGLLPRALAARASALTGAGRTEAVLVADEAVALERARRDHDPLLPADALSQALDGLAEALSMAGRYDEATDVLREAAEIRVSV